jgi:hypothetical protein
MSFPALFVRQQPSHRDAVTSARPKLQKNHRGGGTELSTLRLERPPLPNALAGLN